MNNLINEVERVKYVIKVNGAIVSIPFATPQLAEQAITQLSEAQQSLAEVVAVSADGKEILLG